MDKAAIISTLRAHEADLRCAGAKRISLFGSVARGEEGAESDIDLAVVPDREARGRFSLLDLAGLEQALSRLLDAKAHVTVEPTENPELQAEIDRDRVSIF